MKKLSLISVAAFALLIGMSGGELLAACFDTTYSVICPFATDRACSDECFPVGYDSLCDHYAREVIVWLGHYCDTAEIGISGKTICTNIGAPDDCYYRWHCKVGTTPCGGGDYHCDTTGDSELVKKPRGVLDGDNCTGS